MFKYYVTVFLPLCKKGTQESIHYQVAEYDFDPGLQIGDMVQIKNATFLKFKSNGEDIESSGPKFSFSAQVMQLQKTVETVVPKDLFSIIFKLEITDKEQLPAIIDYFEVETSGLYERHQLPWEAGPLEVA